MKNTPSLNISVAEYLKLANENRFNAVDPQCKYYLALLRCFEMISDLVDKLPHPEKNVSADLLVIAKQSYLGTIDAALSGAPINLYCQLRLSFEAACYALLARSDASYAEAWEQRDLKKEDLKKCRQLFSSVDKQAGKLLSKHSVLSKHQEKLEASYQRLIDKGAHPNVGIRKANSFELDENRFFVGCFKPHTRFAHQLISDCFEFGYDIAILIYAAVFWENFDSGQSVDFVALYSHFDLLTEDAEFRCELSTV